MTQKEELQQRYEAEKAALEADIAKLNLAATEKRNELLKAREKLIIKFRSRLDDLKSAVADGWHNLTEGAATRLNSLLEERASGERAKNR